MSIGSVMKLECSCSNNCRPTAVNAIGVAIEEFHLPKGWIAITGPYPTYCQARQALERFSKDNIERRVYPAFS